MPRGRNRSLTPGETRFLGWSTLVIAGAMVSLVIYVENLPPPEVAARQEAAADFAAALAVLDASRSDCQPAVPAWSHPVPSTAKEKRGHGVRLDIASVEVMGVRLYEPVRAVLAATADLKLLRNDGSRIILTDCAADDIEQERLNAASPNSYIETKKSCVSRVNLSGPNIDLRVEFSEDLPQQPGCMLVSKVYYSQGGSDNDASREEWAKGLTGKYGKPNNPDAFSEQISATWGDEEGPALSEDALDGSYSLTLEDKRFQDDMESAKLTFVSDARTVSHPRL
jgi:hypothetical protein